MYYWYVLKSFKRKIKLTEDFGNWQARSFRVCALELMYSIYRMKSREAAVSFPLVRVWSLLRLFDSSFLPLAVIFLVASCSVIVPSKKKARRNILDTCTLGNIGFCRSSCKKNRINIRMLFDHSLTA